MVNGYWLLTIVLLELFYTMRGPHERHADNVLSPLDHSLSLSRFLSLSLSLTPQRIRIHVHMYTHVRIYVVFLWEPVISHNSFSEPFQRLHSIREGMYSNS